MFEQSDAGGAISAAAANAPNLSYTSTPVFGNMNFTITAPPTDGRVQDGFPALSYLSIESLIFFQNMSQPNNNPALTLPGSSNGQTALNGTITQVDANVTPRFLQGTQPNA